VEEIVFYWKEEPHGDISRRGQKKKKKKKKTKTKHQRLIRRRTYLGGEGNYYKRKRR